MIPPAPIETIVDIFEKTLICEAEIFESIKLDNNEVIKDASIPRNRIETTKRKFVHGANMDCKL